MNRYILGAILGLITVFTIYGLENSGELFQRTTQSATDTISATPSSAADSSGIESAGQNVLRQTSPEGLEGVTSAPNDTGEFTQTPTTVPPVSPNTGTPAPQTVPPQTTIPPTQPTTPATSSTANQDAIPALW